MHAMTPFQEMMMMSSAFQSIESRSFIDKNFGFFTKQSSLLTDFAIDNTLMMIAKGTTNKVNNYTIFVETIIIVIIP